jgi:spore maturation protein SpmB
MTTRLSRVLTATTVFLLGAFLLILILDQATEMDLGRWISPLAAALGVLILIRVLTGIRSWRSRIAAPVIGSVSVQSRMFGFTPGSSIVEHSSGPTDATSNVEADVDLRRSQGADPE